MKKESSKYHYCEVVYEDTTGYVINSLHCYEDESGAFWLELGDVKDVEYVAVNYCPLCGSSAPRQLDKMVEH